jgi:hypothetical protein
MSMSFQEIWMRELQESRMRALLDALVRLLPGAARREELTSEFTRQRIVQWWVPVARRELKIAQGYYHDPDESSRDLVLLYLAFDDDNARAMFPLGLPPGDETGPFEEPWPVSVSVRTRWVHPMLAPAKRLLGVCRRAERFTQAEGTIVEWSIAAAAGAQTVARGMYPRGAAPLPTRVVLFPAFRDADARRVRPLGMPT